jgi:hypothetical protein
MTARALAAVAITAMAARAAAEPMAVVVRDGGDARLAVTRLRGQLADLAVALTIAPGPIEPALEAQLAMASQLAATRGARVVVWFVARGGGLAVAIATPADHRLFVREIPPADPSAVAEAAAIAARGALRAIADGGRIGVEVPDRELPPPAVLGAPSPEPARVGEPARGVSVTLAIGWQVALEGGADAGAHAVAQRTTVASGPWGVLLALSWGPALAHAAAPGGEPVRIDLSRSSAAVGVDRVFGSRFGELELAAAAGVVVYRRMTTTTPSDLSATPAATTAALVAGPELRWQWRPGGAAIGIAVAAGLDVVLGAPDLAVARGAEVVSIGAVRTLQPRFMATVFADLR